MDIICFDKDKIGKRAFCSKNQTYPFVNIKDLDLGGNKLTGLNPCIIRQLSRGFSDFQALKAAQSILVGQAVPKPKISFKQGHASTGTFVKCDCEITKSLTYVDLDGECEHQPNSMQDLKNYQCGTVATINQASVDDECANQDEYDCTEGVDKTATTRQNEQQKPAASSSSPTHHDRNKPDDGKSDVATKAPVASIDNSAIRIQVTWMLVLSLFSSLIIWL